MRSLQAIFFDVDGVILESLDVKANAMAKLFADRPEHVDAIVRYHLENAGVSRYEKFKYFYSELFHQPLSDAEMETLDRRFSDLIRDEMLRCPFVPGARECLAYWSRRVLLFAISGTPEGELRDILKGRGLDSFFQAVRGSPKNKRFHVQELLHEHRLDPANCLFVGDAKSDFEAAQAHGMGFLQRLTVHCSQPLSVGGEKPLAVLNDMSGLSEWLLEYVSGARRPLLLAHSREPVRSLKRRLLPGESWAYLGRNFVRMQSFERQFGDRHPRVQISAALDETARSLRAPFLQYLSGLAEKYAGPEWWGSAVADEDTLAGSLFGDLCLLRVAKNLSLEPNPPAMIIAESEFLLAAIREEIGGERTVWAGSIISELKDRLIFAGRWARFWSRGICAWLLARKSKPKVEERSAQWSDKTAMIHTWAGDGFFTDGRIRDAYFTSLPEELRRRGWTVRMLPRIYGCGLPMSKIFQHLRSRPEDFIIAEDFYGPGDYFRAMATAMRASRMPSLPQTVAGLKIDRLVQQARRRQMMNTESAVSFMYMRLIEEMARAKMVPSVFIGTFENAAAEKPIVLAIRKLMPTTKTVGFQHGLVPAPLMLQNFAALSVAERTGAMPDVVVCSSKFAKELFVREGVSEDRLRVGPSLRHLYLLEEVLPEKRKSKAVFVPLSLDPASAAELIAILHSAFPEASGIQFWLKPHPMMSPNVWENIIRLNPPAPHFQCVTGAIGDWTKIADCAVVAGSASALDLAIAGLPVVITGRAAVVDYNPLDYFEEWPKPVRTSEELRERVTAMASLSPAERKKYSEWSKWARRQLLSPLNDATVGAFVEFGKERCAA